MKKIMIIAVLVLAVLGLAAGGFFYYRANTSVTVNNPVLMPDTGQVGPENIVPVLKDGIPADYMVVDVRTPKEYNSGHTEGTVNIPVALFEKDGACEDIIPLLDRKKKILFLCPFGPRAEEMYYDLTDATKDGGCGINPDGLYYAIAKVKFKKDGLVIR